MTRKDFESRFRGGIRGLAVGDALGVAVEFQSREQVARNPVTGMRGHGTHNQPPGTWSDDTSLSLCLLEGQEKGLNLKETAELFVAWMKDGYWTPHGHVFDIGQATREALTRIEDFPEDPREAGLTTEWSNGNGSLMRTLPVALMNPQAKPDEMARLAHDYSHLTHGHPRSLMACGIYCDLVRRILHGTEPGEAWEHTRQWALDFYQQRCQKEVPVYEFLLSSNVADFKDIPAAEVESSGYVLHTLFAALWSFFTTENFSDCVLRAVNLGDDSDTTGAVAGGLAGVSYGAGAIPQEWLKELARLSQIEELINQALERVSAKV